MSNTEALPKLPEPAFNLTWHDDRARYTVSAPNLGSTACYTADQMRAYARQALAQPAALCHCKDRPAADCPGEWEPGCDLGANPAHVVVAQPAETDAELKRRTGEPHVDGWPLYSGLPPPAASGEPATLQLWCETCEGTGQVHQEHQRGVIGSGGTFDCPDCDGNGFVKTSRYVLAAPAQPAPALVPLTDAQIEALALEHEDFGFGQVDAHGLTTHGFSPEGLAAFARALLAAAGTPAKEAPL